MPRATCVCTVQADPEMADATGLTPIIIAAQQGSMPLIKLLMEAGGARITGVDHHGLNLLGVAAELGGFDSITQQLLSNIYSTPPLPLAHKTMCAPSRCQIKAIRSRTTSDNTRL